MVKFGGAADNQVLSEFELESREGSGFGEIATDETGIVTRCVPRDFELGEAYPNPFNPTTSISVSLPESAELTVQVYNLSGRLVATLSEGHMDAGSHSLTFDGSNLASGVYFVHAIVPGELNATRKLVLMK